MTLRTIGWMCRCQRRPLNTHLMAICQPCVATLAATALMSEDEHPATKGNRAPSSLAPTLLLIVGAALWGERPWRRAAATG